MSEESTRSTGQALKLERERRGWSRRYVAERIGGDLQSVGRWERGESFPNPYYRQHLCELFEKDAVSLGLLPGETGTIDGQDEQAAAHVQQSEGKRPEETLAGERRQPLNDRARPVHVLLRQSIASQRLPARIVVASLAIVIIVLLVSFWRLQVNSIVPSTAIVPSTSRSPAQTVILPGGEWVSPINGQSYRGSIHFAARAYPNSFSDPSINYVNFTANWEGGWRIVCTVRVHADTDLYSCNVNLGQHGAPAGPIRISFDVYDQAGNVHLAPNGIHTIFYTP